MIHLTEKHQTYLSNEYNKWLMSNIFAAKPYALVLLGEHRKRTEDGRSGGMPAVPQVISGSELTQTQMNMALNATRFVHYWKTAKPTDDSVRAGNIHTRATISDPTNGSGGLNQKSAAWASCKLDTPMEVQQSDLENARDLLADPKMRGQAVLDIIKQTQDDFLGVHFTAIANDLINGDGPTNQDADMWDKPLPLIEACKANNVYAGIDRSIAANVAWRGNYVSSAMPLSLKAIVDYANYEMPLGCGTGTGFVALGRVGIAKMAMAGPTIFSAWRDEAENRIGGIVPNPTEQIDLVKYGFTSEVVQYQGVTAFCDPSMPDNAACLFNPKDFMLGFKKGMRAKMTPWADPTKATPGQREILFSNIISHYFFVCLNPTNQVWFANVA